MARPADPHDDLIRCAELVDQTATLVSRGINAEEILRGLAIRIREDVDRILSDDYWPILTELRRHLYDYRNKGSKPDDPGWHVCMCGWEGYWCDWQPHVATHVTDVVCARRKGSEPEESQDPHDADTWPTITGSCVEGCTFAGHAPGCTLMVKEAR